MNSIIMTIENYSKKFQEAKRNGTRLYSDSHIILGYKLRLQVDLNGCKDGKGTHMSVSVQLMNDGAHTKPFDKAINLILIHPDDQNKCIRRIFKRDEEEAIPEGKHELKIRTIFSSILGPDGYTKFITLKELHDGGFIKNDILYIRCVVES